LSSIAKQAEPYERSEGGEGERGAVGAERAATADGEKRTLNEATVAPKARREPTSDEARRAEERGSEREE